MFNVTCRVCGGAKRSRNGDWSCLFCNGTGKVDLIMAAIQIQDPPTGGLALPHPWPVWAALAQITLVMSIALTAIGLAADKRPQKVNKPTEVIDVNQKGETDVGLEAGS